MRIGIAEKRFMDRPAHRFPSLPFRETNRAVKPRSTTSLIAGPLPITLLIQARDDMGRFRMLRLDFPRHVIPV